MISELGSTVSVLLFLVASVAASSLGVGLGANGQHQHEGGVYHCAGIGPQELMDIEETMGMWYIVEVVHHRYDARFPKGESVVDTCPIIYLSRVQDQYQQPDPTAIRLIWSENAGSLYYNFRMEQGRPGFWISSGPQNGNSSKFRPGMDQIGHTGSMTTMNTPYRQFAGIVEVTKAVNTHMVLTFCMPGQQLFSIVMSRKKFLPKNELRSVNSLLERKGLPRVATREACKGAANRNTAFYLFLPVTLILTYISRT